MVRQWSMSMVVYFVAMRLNVFVPYGFPDNPFYAYSVGFDIAYPRMEGNARA
ncbi:MAG: hypothetical protein MJZ46_05595 [Bacteroidales bacterium]|nr:hypothetical protein [Bacteroidales bacterium]MCQ2269757.1 hypothetical protein [Bacteroidales bacterium]